MSCVFSTRDSQPVVCEAPQLVIGFPRCGAGSPNTVTLANGAVVDLVELGRIVAAFCPAFADPSAVVQTTD